MASVAAGVLGDAELPWNMIATGAAVGVLIIACDEVLKARKAGFRMPVLAVAVGIYLPVELAVSHLPGRSAFLPWPNAREAGRLPVSGSPAGRGPDSPARRCSAFSSPS